MCLLVAIALLHTSSLLLTFHHNTQEESSEKIELSVPLIDIALNVNSFRGEKMYNNVWLLKVPHDSCILFKPVLVSVGGIDNIVVNGYMLLTSVNDSVSYKILMPCMVSRNATCFRIMVLIPGYDAPLKIRRGVYKISLYLSWNASGRGRVRLVFPCLCYTCSHNASMHIIINGRPSSATGWIVANGSTRSYSLIVDNTTVLSGPNGYGVFRVWVWQLASWTTPENTTSPRMYEVYVYNHEKKLVAYAIIPVIRAGMYYQALITIKLRPGTYKLVVKFPLERKTLSVPLKVIEH